MKRTSISHGIYSDETGSLWSRPTIDGRRTWRKLTATTLKAALVEVATTDFSQRESTFAQLAQLYLDDACPSATLEQRPHLLQREQVALDHLLPFFGSMLPSDIRLHHLPKYRDYRVKRLTREVAGNRTVELDWVTLSAILNYAVATGRTDTNWIRQGRPRLRRPSDITRCRSRAPIDSDDLHDIAAQLFASPGTEVLGWQMLVEAMTGCRTSEVLRLRTDAAPRQPGHIDGNLLWLERSKHGVNPFAQVHPALHDTIQAHHAWLADRSPWWFPSIEPDKPTDRTALTLALKRITHGRLTSHGLRSFYVTTRRSQGATDAQIAAEIGDTTVSLIASTYGDRPPTWWNGSSDLSWLPLRDTRPAWSRNDRPQAQAIG